MINSCSVNACPVSLISWMWYTISVIICFGFGFIWYGLLFGEKLKKAKCKCDPSKPCICSCHSMFPFFVQFICTALLGLMYFVLMIYGSYPLALLVAVAISGWLKASLKFEIASWKRYFTVALIEVGYFFLVSLIFMFFGTLH